MSWVLRNRSISTAVFGFVVGFLYFYFVLRPYVAKPNQQSQFSIHTPPPEDPTTTTPTPITSTHAITNASNTLTTTTQDPFNIASHGFWEGMGATRAHIFDEKLAARLVQFFQDEQAWTVIELGAGMGTYTKFLRESGSGFHVSCYDGNPQTQELSLGRCAMIDLSKPMDFDKHDWTLSLEVGEHIPREMEPTFLSNLNGGTRLGVILSWGIEGQTGTGHVNNHNNSYVREKFQDMGYISDPVAEKGLRDASKYSWFKTSIMVFRRNCTVATEKVEEVEDVVPETTTSTSTASMTQSISTSTNTSIGNDTVVDLSSKISAGFENLTTKAPKT